MRADICEALLEEFSDQTVVVAETMESVAETYSGLTAPVVAILSLSSELVKAPLDQLSRMMPDVSFVLIDDAAPENFEGGTAFLYLPRPFSSDSLIAIVKTATAGLPSDRS
ncbi:MAG: hypothetical protein HKP51_03340 [Sulfitobacter sp.]|nr:hypothetical protein [Sulfitobacter sp.]